jgi:hypothetical protein
VNVLVVEGCGGKGLKGGRKGRQEGREGENRKEDEKDLQEWTGYSNPATIPRSTAAIWASDRPLSRWSEMDPPDAYSITIHSSVPTQKAL